ncbi:MAG TPA: hypothetical protein VF363_01810 [Candidatus Eisenbacteria bacterium]
MTLAVLCALATLGVGCIFDPPKKTIIIPPKLIVYPPRNTPKNAVLYLKAAWENRDSTRADTVYAVNYTGTSSVEGVSDLTFGRLEEIRALGGVQIAQSVTRVTFDFHDPSTWIRQEYATDSSTWVAYSIPAPRIEVDQLSGSLVADQSTFFEFTMRPYVVAPGDTLWQIVRWVERNPAPPS